MHTATLVWNSIAAKSRAQSEELLTDLKAAFSTAPGLADKLVCNEIRRDNQGAGAMAQCDFTCQISTHYSQLLRVSVESGQVRILIAIENSPGGSGAGALNKEPLEWSIAMIAAEAEETVVEFASRAIAVAIQNHIDLLLQAGASPAEAKAIATRRWS